MSLVNLSPVRDCLRAIILGACVENKLFSLFFSSEKLRQQLNNTSVDHRLTSVQDQTANRCEDLSEEVKLLLKGPLSTKSKAVQTMWCFWAGKTGHTHQVILTHRSTEGRSLYTTEEVQRLDKAHVQWASSSNSLQTSGSGELHPYRVHW